MDLPLRPNPDASDRVEILDLAIPAFLGAHPNFKTLLSTLDGKDGRPDMHSKLNGITDALRLIPQHVDLWEWPDIEQNRAQLRGLLSECRMLSYGVARISKMLHLKRPQLIPVIDDWIRRAWSGCYSENWTFDDLVEITFAMAKELGARHKGLNEIREVAQEMGWPYNSLSRLRLYDVTFWDYENEARREDASSHPFSSQPEI